MQPAPTGQGEIVLNRVLKAFRARAALGFRRYGTLLRTFNGRSALQDLHEELMDAVMYVTQLIMEKESRSNKNILQAHQDLQSKGIEVLIDPESRWALGIEHDERSVEILEGIMALDRATGDYFELKVGGDGDNGERLAFLLDALFEIQDKTG